MQRIMFPLACMVLLALPYSAPVLAQRELFSSTEATHHSQSPLTLLLGAIEPAAGGAAPEAPKHQEPKANSHGEEPKKSHTGKELTGPQPLPEVFIGGERVQRQIEKVLDLEVASTPVSLRKPEYARQLANRLSLTPFAHSPRIGPHEAPITLIIYEDLSCISCTTASQAISLALQDVINPATSTSLTQVIWIHAANQRWQTTNLSAFYGKVAARYGKFFEFRTLLLASPERTPEAAFGMLVELGLEPRQIRQTMLTEARRFYRELDGDLMQGRSFGISNPPVILVNGIRVGEGWLPLSLLPDILTYVNNRFANGLAEPPL